MDNQKWQAILETDQSAEQAAADLNRQFDDAGPDKILEWAADQFGDRLVAGTGFGPSGAVLMHKLHQQKLPVTVFYIDTHLLFRQTYELRDRFADELGIRFDRVSTDVSVADQEREYGSDLWSGDPDLCCYIRKVKPLENYLQDKLAWVTGVRRDQAQTRKDAQFFEWDGHNRVIKINPLADWTAENVWTYIRIYDLPYNPLHDHGYPSIGCQPCTKPVKDGDERAGRWSGRAKTECGIHTVAARSRTQSGSSAANSTDDPE